MSRTAAWRTAFVVGLAVGLAVGLIYAWVIDPVSLVNTYPALLQIDYRRDWVRLTALSYVATGNLKEARARLAGIGKEDVTSAIEALIEEYAVTGRPAETLRSLTSLALAVDAHTPAMLVYLGTSSPSTASPPLTSTPSPSPSPSPSPTLSPSPVPSLTSTPTSSPTPSVVSPLETPTPEPTSTPLPPTPTPLFLARLQLTQQEQICQPNQEPSIEVVVRDERGTEVPGIEVWLMWSGGADRAVTGLKPQRGAGYVDFGAERGISYSIGVGKLGRPLVTNLRLESCPEEEIDEESEQERLIGSWRLVLEPHSPEVEAD